MLNLILNKYLYNVTKKIKELITIMLVVKQIVLVIKNIIENCDKPFILICETVPTGF